MVKPAEPYLDIIKSAKEKSSLPIAAYQVSGEYSRFGQSINSDGWTLIDVQWSRYFVLREQG